MKTCTICEETKLESEFYRYYADCPSYLYSECKECTKARRKRDRTSTHKRRNQKERENFKRNFDRHFFKSWSPSMAYVLGLVFAEATIGRDRLVFQFGESSLPILENISALLQCNEPLRKIDNHGFPAWRLILSSVGMVSDLAKYGLCPGRKSGTIRVPENLPEELARHFVRGYWEGDGSITPYVKFCSASKEFLVELSALITGQLGLTSHLYTQDGAMRKFPQGKVLMTKESHELVYISQVAKSRIFTWFYDGIEPPLYSETKRLRFETALQSKNSYDFTYRLSSSVKQLELSL